MATKTRKDPGSNASFASITAATKCLGFTDNGFKNLRNNKTTTDVKLFFLKLNVTAISAVVSEPGRFNTLTRTSFAKRDNQTQQSRSFIRHV